MLIQPLAIPAPTTPITCSLWWWSSLWLWLWLSLWWWGWWHSHTDDDIEDFDGEGDDDHRNCDWQGWWYWYLWWGGGWHLNLAMCGWCRNPGHTANHHNHWGCQHDCETQTVARKDLRKSSEVATSVNMYIPVFDQKCDWNTENSVPSVGRQQY